MISPFTKDKIVFDPDESSFYLVSEGIMGSPRPFRNIKWFRQNGKLFSASEARVKECVMSDAGQRFGTASILSELGQDAGELGIIEFEDLPEEIRADAIERARKYCVGVLEATEVPGMTQDELENELDRLLDEMEEDVESETVDEDLDEDEIEIIPTENIEVED